MDRLEKWAEGFESVCEANGVDPEALITFVIGSKQAGIIRGIPDGTGPGGMGREFGMRGRLGFPCPAVSSTTVVVKKKEEDKEDKKDKAKDKKDKSDKKDKDNK